MEDIYGYLAISIFFLVVITVGTLLIAYSKRINDLVMKAVVKVGRTTRVGRFLLKIAAEAWEWSYDELLEYPKKYPKERHWGITVNIWIIRIVGIVIVLTAFVWWLVVIVTDGF